MKRRIVLSLCSVLLTLGAIEIALRAPAAQVWLASQFHLVLEPFRAFEEVAENGATYVQKRKLEQPRYSVHDVRFAKHKAPGRVRVFTFGGSTTYGMPYTLAAGQAGDVSFGTWLREDVKLRGGVELEVINCGAIGMPVEGVRDVVQECFDYEPDVFLVLSGHNEFLPHALLAARSRVRSAFSLAVASPWRKLRLVALLEQFAISLAERNSPGVGTRDYPIADSPIQPAFHTEAESAFIEHRYQQTLQWIVAACRARHVQLVLGTPPGNLKDFEPSFSTLHAANDAERERWLALLRAGRAAVESGDAERGGELLARAVAEHPENAEAHYRLGLALAARADAAGARAQLELARDLDGAIRRATGAILDAVRGAAHGAGVELADCDADCRRASPLGLPGGELFVDHVHPTLPGVAVIARSMREALERLHVIDPPHGPEPDRARIESALKISELLKLNVELTIGTNYANLIMLRHHDPERRFEIAAAHLQRYIDQTRAVSGAAAFTAKGHAVLGGLAVLAKQAARARAEFDAAEQLDPRWRRDLLDLIKQSPAIQKLFREQGFRDLLDN